MKKSLKLMALGLAVVPCALVLTACGGDDGKLVNTDGNYAAIETTEYASVLTDLETRGLSLDNILGGARLTLDLDAEIDVLGTTMTASMTSDNYVRNTSEQGQVDVKKIDMISENSLSLVAETDGEAMEYSASVNQYLNGGVQYVDLTGAEELLTAFGMQNMITNYKFYQNLAKGDESDVAVLPSYSITDLLDVVPEETWGTNVIIEKSEEGDDYKIRTTIKGDFLKTMIESALSQGSEQTTSVVTFNSIGDVVIYIVYNEAGLAGINVTASIDMIANIPLDDTSSMPLAIKADVELNMVGYNGEFDFPSDFNTYTELDTSASTAVIG